jgi:hypothetical protein
LSQFAATQRARHNLKKNDRKGGLLMTEAQVSEERRLEIFLALVEAQDDEMPVDLSRKAIAEQFGITEETLQQIEREGLDKDWPPLD